jgi:hypothetical protein
MFRTEIIVWSYKKKKHIYKCDSVEGAKTLFKTFCDKYRINEFDKRRYSEDFENLLEYGILVSSNQTTIYAGNV